MKTKITPNIYKNIHVMGKSGMAKKDIAEVFGLHVTTICNVLRTESLDQYHHYNASKTKRSVEKKKRSAHVEAPVAAPTPIQKVAEAASVITDMKLPGGTLSANYQFNTMLELLKKQNEIMTLISNKLAYIIDELT